MRHPLHRLAALAAAAALPALVAVPAHGSGDDEVRREGRCGGRVEWKIKVKPDDGRLEVEAEIDSDRRGQRWTWVLTHNGSTSDRGASTTSGPSGSFDVERLAVDVAGADTFRFRAQRKGVTCVAQVTF